MTDQRSRIDAEYGTAAIDVDEPVVAGTYQTWTITYTVGALGMDDGSTLMVAYSMTTDMGTPQFYDPTGANYVSVTTSGTATVSATFDAYGHVRPYRSTIVVSVEDGALAPGDTITITLGECTDGSMGIRAQSFPEQAFRFRPLVDAHGTGEFVQLPADLTFDIIAGRAQAVSAVAPSTAAAGDTVEINVRATDYWGNTARRYSGSATVDAGTTTATVDITAGTGSTELTLETGAHRLQVTTDEFETETNPLVVGMEWPETYWGDIHGQSGETVGTGSVWDYMRFARDDAFVDFASHAGNDFQISEDLWIEIRGAFREFHDPGKFVTIPCYEWSANTSLGGDHNVYFRDESAVELNRSSSWQVHTDYEKHEGIHPVSALYEYYEGRDDVLIIPHQGGRPAALEVLDPELTPFVEVCSVWGVFEWFGQDALEHGVPIGFVGGSDDHSGRPGATPPDNLPEHNVRGGLMGTMTDELTREGLWDAFTDRRVYATTGVRSLLDVSIAGERMGGRTTTTSAVDVAATVYGTAPIRRIDLIRETECVCSVEPGSGDPIIELVLRGARGRVRNKVMDWSGGISIDRGHISTVDAFGIHHPEQGVTARSATAVEWDAYTSGNTLGFRFALDAPPETTITVATGPATVSAALGDLPAQAAAEGLEANLTIRQTRRTSEADRDVTASFEDTPPTGQHHYYVRVEQTDGHLLFSSPTLVDVQ